MKLKTYVAPNLQEALSQVKKDLGPEAVILSTQSRRTFSPDSHRPHTEVEVRAAMDEPDAECAKDFFPDPPLARSPLGSLLQQFQTELREMKGLLAQWMIHQGPPVGLSPYDDLMFLYEKLVAQGLPSQVLQSWLIEIQGLLAATDKSPNRARDAALRLLMQAIDVVNLWQRLEKGGARHWTFLGPAGVGKTATVAKLAAHFALGRGKTVGLISLGDLRLGAQDQLAVYGRLIGIPLIAVTQRQGLLEALTKLRDWDLILIDTPGQSPAAPEVLQLLQGIPDLEHHLVLSSAFSESNLAAAVAGFSRAPLTSLIITKVDEGHSFSGLFNQLCRQRLPVSYLTTGPRIPQDIEPASRQRLVGLFLASSQGKKPDTEAGGRYEQAVGA